MEKIKIENLHLEKQISYTIKGSICLDPHQDKHFVGPELSPKYLKSNQQMTLADKDLNLITAQF